MVRSLVVLLSLSLLAACAGARDLKDPPVPLGNFSLGHNVVVSPKVQRLPLSREASEDELNTALKKAIADRFDRYDGAKDYHFGVSVEGYNLAPPGIPIVLSPKSAMIVRITVWDDALGKKLNEKAEQITVLEQISGDTIVGSGLTQTKEQQLRNLAENVSKAIERYLVRQNKEMGWFNDTPTDVAAAAAPEPAPAVVE